MKALILLLAVCAYAQLSPPCTSPQQWMAYLRRYDQTQNVYTRGQYYYDALNQRTAEQELDNEKGVLTRAWVIDLWRAFPPTRYYINQTVVPTTCVKTPLNDSFHEIGVPPTARYDSDQFIGCGGIRDGAVETFTYQQDNRNGTLIQTFTTHACVPVHFVRITNTTNPPDVRVADWYNVVLGIDNPNVFIPPPECK